MGERVGAVLLMAQLNTQTMSALDVGVLVGIPSGVTLLCVGYAFANEWTLHDFKMWQLILASLHLCFALVMLVLTATNESWVINVNLVYNVWNVNDIGSCNEDSPCSISLASKNIGDFHTTMLVPFFSIVSGLHHLYATLSYASDDKYNEYDKAVKRGINYASPNSHYTPEGLSNVPTV